MSEFVDKVVTISFAGSSDPCEVSLRFKSSVENTPEARSQDESCVVVPAQVVKGVEPKEFSVSTVKGGVYKEKKTPQIENSYDSLNANKVMGDYGMKVFQPFNTERPPECICSLCRRSVPYTMMSNEEYFKGITYRRCVDCVVSRGPVHNPTSILATMKILSTWFCEGCRQNKTLDKWPKIERSRPNTVRRCADCYGIQNSSPNIHLDRRMCKTCRHACPLTMFTKNIEECSNCYMNRRLITCSICYEDQKPPQFLKKMKKIDNPVCNSCRLARDRLGVACLECFEFKPVGSFEPETLFANAPCCLSCYAPDVLLRLSLLTPENRKIILQTRYDILHPDAHMYYDTSRKLSELRNMNKSGDNIIYPIGFGTRNPHSKEPFYYFKDCPKEESLPPKYRRLLRVLFSDVCSGDFDVEVLYQGFSSFNNMLFHGGLYKNTIPQSDVIYRKMYFAIHKRMTLPTFHKGQFLTQKPCRTNATSTWLLYYKMLAKCFMIDLKYNNFYNLMKRYFVWEKKHCNMLAILKDDHESAARLIREIPESPNSNRRAINSKVRKGDFSESVAHMFGMKDKLFESLAPTKEQASEVLGTFGDALKDGIVSFLGNWPQYMGDFIDSIVAQSASSFIQGAYEYFKKAFLSIKSAVKTLWDAVVGSDSDGMVTALTVLFFVMAFYVLCRTVQLSFSAMKLGFVYALQKMGFNVSVRVQEAIDFIGTQVSCEASLTAERTISDAHGISSTLVTAAGFIAVMMVDPRWGGNMSSFVNAVGRGAPMIESFEEDLKNVIDYIYFKVSGQHFFDSKKEVEAFDQFLQEYWDFTETPSLGEKVLKDPVYTRKLADLLGKAKNLKSIHSSMKGTPLFTRFMKTYDTLMMHHQQALADAEMYKNRIETVLVWMDGKCGHGKSTMLKAMPEVLHKMLMSYICDLPSWSPGLVYEKVKGSPFWERYRNQLYMTMNEILSSTNPQEKGEELRMIMNMCENNVYNLHMPFEDKGMVFFQSYIAFLTTNATIKKLMDPHKPHGVDNPEAVVRRMTFPLSVIRNCDFVLTNNIITNANSAWSFRVYCPDKKWKTEWNHAICRHLEIHFKDEHHTAGSRNFEFEARGFMDFTFEEIMVAMTKELIDRINNVKEGSLGSKLPVPQLNDDRYPTIKKMEEISELVNDKVPPAISLPEKHDVSLYTVIDKQETIEDYFSKVKSDVAGKSYVVSEMLGLPDRLSFVPPSSACKAESDCIMDLISEGRDFDKQYIAYQKLGYPYDRRTFRQQWNRPYEDTTERHIYFMNLISAGAITNPSKKDNTCSMSDAHMFNWAKVKGAVCERRSQREELASTFRQMNGSSENLWEEISATANFVARTTRGKELPLVAVYLAKWNLNSELSQPPLFVNGDLNSLHPLDRYYFETDAFVSHNYKVGLRTYAQGHFIDCGSITSLRSILYQCDYQDVRTILRSARKPDPVMIQLLMKKYGKSPFHSVDQIIPMYDEAVGLYFYTEDDGSVTWLSVTESVCCNSIYRMTNRLPPALFTRVHSMEGSLMFDMVLRYHDMAYLQGKIPSISWTDRWNLLKKNAADSYVSCMEMFQKNSFYKWLAISALVVGILFGVVYTCFWSDEERKIYSESVAHGRRGPTLTREQKMERKASHRPDIGAHSEMHRSPFDAKIYRPHVSSHSEMHRTPFDPKTHKPHISSHSPMKHVDPRVNAHGGEDDSIARAWKMGANYRIITLVYDGLKSVTCTAVQSGVVLILNAHVLRSKGMDVKKIVIEAHGDVPAITIDERLFVFRFCDYDTSDHLSQDLVYVHVHPRVLAPAADLTGYMRLKEHWSLPDKIARVSQSSKGIMPVYNPGSVVKMPTQSRIYDDNGNFSQFQDTEDSWLVHGSPSQFGYCGQVYIDMSHASGKQYLLGMHMAGTPFDSYFTPLYKDEMLHYFDWESNEWHERKVTWNGGNWEISDAHMPYSCHTPAGCYISPEVEKTFGPAKEGKYEGSLCVATLAKPMFMPTETGIVPSVFNRPEGEPSLHENLVGAPAHLKPFWNGAEWLSPLEKACHKFFSVDKSNATPSWLINYESSAPGDTTEGFFGNITPSKPLRRLNPYEALSTGILGKVDSKTSEGYFLRTFKIKRKDAFKVDKDTGVCTWIHPVVLQEIDRIVAAVERGEIPKLITIACLKDEVRDLERVDLGKTRLFCVGDFVHMIWMRMVIGDGVRELKEHRGSTTSCIGINYHSSEWMDLYRKYSNFKGKFGGGDYSNYDTSLRFEGAWEMGVCFARFYGYAFATFEYREVLYCCCSCCAPIVIVQSYVYFCYAVNPSGNWGTGLYNTFYNNRVMKITWLQEQQKCSEECNHDPRRGAVCNFINASFSRDLHLSLYGDDNIWAIKEEFSKHWTMPIIESRVKALSSMTYTTPSKNAISNDFLEKHELEFLKRKFTIRDGFLYPTLDKESIQNMLDWIKDTGSLQGNREQLQQNIKAASMEMAYYGKSEWDDWAFRVQNACRRFNVLWTGETYHRWMDRYTDTYL